MYDEGRDRNPFRDQLFLLHERLFRPGRPPHMQQRVVADRDHAEHVEGRLQHRLEPYGAGEFVAPVWRKFGDAVLWRGRGRGTPVAVQ